MKKTRKFNFRKIRLIFRFLRGSKAYFAVAVASGIFTYVSRTNMARAGENFAKNLRDALFCHVQRLPMKVYAGE